MGEFRLGDKIIVHPVYNKTGEWIGFIECCDTEAREFVSFYKVDNRLARKFDIMPNRQFSSVGAIMEIINGG